MQIVNIWEEMPSAANIQFPESEFPDIKVSSLEMWMQWEAHRLRLLADCEAMVQDLTARMPECEAKVVVDMIGMPSVSFKALPRPAEVVTINATVLQFPTPQEPV